LWTSSSTTLSHIFHIPIVHSLLLAFRWLADTDAAGRKK
jgi:hypothetical protein